jgi:hypothetical protein
MKYVVVVTFMFLLVITGLIAYRDFSPGDKYATPATCGIIAYDWNEPVTKAHRGFPWFQPPINNYDWTKPINYAQGTFYYRAQIKSQPVAQDMKLQLCFWQSKPGGTAFGIENCASTKDVKGTSGNVVTWSQTVQSMWKKDGVPIDWTRERFRAGVAIKNSKGQPVSDYSNFNWGGENPDRWYPLDMRYTAIVVPKDGAFCGWDYYLKGSTPMTPVPNTPVPNTPVPNTPVPNTPVPSTPVPNTPVPTTMNTPIPTTAQTPVPNTPTAKPINTLAPTDSGIAKCGKADIDGNGYFDLNDFSKFAIAYGTGKNKCGDTQADHLTYGPCGGKDVNRDGTLDIMDFGGPQGFAQRYGPHRTCSL